jgi:hypothetical protein
VIIWLCRLTNNADHELARGFVDAHNQAVVHDFLVGQEQRVVVKSSLKVFFGVLSDIKGFVVRDCRQAASLAKKARILAKREGNPLWIRFSSSRTQFFPEEVSTIRFRREPFKSNCSVMVLL